MAATITTASIPFRRKEYINRWESRSGVSESPVTECDAGTAQVHERLAETKVLQSDSLMFRNQIVRCCEAGAATILHVDCFAGNGLAAHRRVFDSETTRLSLPAFELGCKKLNDHKWQLIVKVD